MLIYLMKVTEVTGSKEVFDAMMAKKEIEIWVETLTSL